jgi:molybdenum cofactor cytidylyltransferase
MQSRGRYVDDRYSRRHDHSMACSNAGATHATIDGIVLAAGQSRRMGQPKAALTMPDGASFLDRAVSTLRAAGCRRVLVVVNAAVDAAHDRELELVVNAVPQSEQIDSVRLALEQLDDSTAAVMVLPVDLPLITAATAAAVAASFRAHQAPVVVPCHDGVAGHPVLLARTVFEEILERDWEEGIRSLLLAHERETRTVTVQDPGIVIDIDTPEDYTRYVVRQ